MEQHTEGCHFVIMYVCILEAVCYDNAESWNSATVQVAVCLLMFANGEQILHPQTSVNLQYLSTSCSTFTVVQKIYSIDNMGLQI